MSELKVTEIACETAHEFVDYLRLSKEHWGDLSSSHSPWLFRGQANSEWPILPSLYRPRPVEPTGFDPWLFDLKEDIIRKLKNRVNHSRRFSKTKYANIINQHSSVNKPHLFDCLVYYFLEKKLLHDFILNADSNEFEIPELDDLFLDDPVGCEDDDSFEKHLIESMPKLIDEMEISQQVAYLKENKVKIKAYVGLAQHHGISTRLIDLTYNPLTAAYFASSNFRPNSVNENRKIVVWGINTHIFSANFRTDLDIIPFQKRRLASYQLYKLPRNKNSYLHRQEGLFIYPEYPYSHYFLKGKFPSFEDYFTPIVSTNPEYYRDNYIRKTTLPYSQVSNLLRILDREGISKAKMMPTLDNVAESLKNRWKWEAWASKNSGSIG